MTRISRLEAAPTRSSSHNRTNHHHATKDMIGKISYLTSRSRRGQAPKSAKDRYRDLRNKVKELNILVQQATFCVDQPGNVPHEHRTKFEDIQMLGNLEFASYGLHPSPDKPWQRANKKRAITLNKLAIRCKEEMRNEGGWRAAVEFRLFERFEIEVACKQCRGRLWQSEIEVDQTAGNSRTTSLKERQARREPCECGPVRGTSDLLDAGLSEIFSCRIQEPNIIIIDDEPKSAPVRKEPDRIHGLQSTPYLENLLNQHYGAQSQHGSEPSLRLVDILQTSCNPDSGGRKLLFPFLVMEAKSGRGGSNFDEIEIQTALPIRNLLILQHQLQQAECNRMKVPGGPLAWFFANVGPTWRVYGCYVTLSGDKQQPHWNIILLWEGSITGINAALQLVLIVDYILDWARDIYRPSIIRQLKCFATRGAHSSFTVSDLDIISNGNPVVRNWLGGQGGQAPVPTVVTTDAAESQVLLANDFHAAAERRWHHPIRTDKHGWVRYGTVLVSSVRGLWITVDNIKTLLQGFANDKAKESFISEICEIIKVRTRCCILPSAQPLKAIEELWTTDSTYPTTLFNTLRPTLVSLHVRFWVTDSWELMRELTYLAITDEAYDYLIPFAKRQILGLTKDWQSVPEDSFVNFVKTENIAFTEDFFLRCLKREVLVLHHAPRMNFRRDSRLKSSTGRLGELVSSIYKTYQIGLRRPAEAFIRDIDTPRNILPSPEHPVWSANTDGILVSGGYHGLCLYVTKRVQRNNTSSWLFQNLASRLALEEQVFNASLGKVEIRSTHCSLESNPQVLNKLAAWIISEKPGWSPMEYLRDTFPNDDMFDKLMMFEQKHQKAEDYRFVEFSWSRGASKKSQ